MLFPSALDDPIRHLLTGSALLLQLVEYSWDHITILGKQMEVVYRIRSENNKSIADCASIDELLSLMEPEDSVQYRSRFNQTWGSVQPSSLEYSLQIDSGEHVWFSSTFCYAQTEGDGRPYMFVFSKEITAAKEQEAFLRSMAYNDPLTGLPNRRALQEHFVQAAAYSKRYQLQFGVIYIDVDDFKLINDRYGHGVGDRFLQMTSQLLSQCLRESDVLARVGGDEFVVLLNNVSSDDVLNTVINRMYKRVSEGIALEGGSRVEVSLSIGASLYPVHGETLDGLLEAADSALYMAKKGKNTYLLSE